MLEMRELRGDDVFSLLGIVGKLDIKDEFVKLFDKQTLEKEKTVVKLEDHKKKEPTKADLVKIEKAEREKEKEIEKRGMEMMANVLQTVLINISKVKVDINQLLADLCGVPLQEVKVLGLKDYTGLLISFFKKEELKDFFTSIASLLK